MNAFKIPQDLATQFAQVLQIQFNPRGSTAATAKKISDALDDTSFVATLSWCNSLKNKLFKTINSDAAGDSLVAIGTSEEKCRNILLKGFPDFADSLTTSDVSDTLGTKELITRFSEWGRTHLPVHTPPSSSSTTPWNSPGQFRRKPKSNAAQLPPEAMVAEMEVSGAAKVVDLEKFVSQVSNALNSDGRMTQEKLANELISCFFDSQSQFTRFAGTDSFREFMGRITRALYQGTATADKRTLYKTLNAFPNMIKTIQEKCRIPTLPLVEEKSHNI